MPTISNISFTVKFDLTSTPTLVITDTSTIPSGAAGRLSITLPDNYTRVGDYTSPDISSSGGAYSYPLRLDSTGNVQTGQYTILYEIKTSDGVVSTFSKVFQFDYVPVKLDMAESFDVFTPQLSYSDNTVYQRSNYSYSGLTRAWSAVSTPTGTITGSSTTLSLISGGKYYDASYTITLTSSLTYTHQVYTWLTVTETIAKTISTYAETPANLSQIITLISALKTKLDGLVNYTQLYYDTKEDFQTAQTYFVHIIDKIKVGNTSNIYVDLKSLIAILHNNQIPTYVAKNAQILPYDLTSYFPGAVWGAITGSITSQTDLWGYLQTLNAHDNYVFTQSAAASVWTITHNMGKYPSVTIVDTANDEVEGQVNHISNTQLTVTFSAPVAGKAFMN
jgi:hypothetical protein